MANRLGVDLTGKVVVMQGDCPEAERTVCNPCGLKAAKILDALGSVTSQTILHPAAQEALDSGVDNPLANYIREEQRKGNR